MPWPLRLVEYKKGMSPAAGTLKVGDLFYGPYPHELEQAAWRSVRWHFRYLSEFYHANNAQRRPLAVVLPGNHLFGIDGQCWNHDLPIPHYGGWTVTGDAPNITMSPSINLGGLYHGFIQNGLISEDVEQRKYGVDGYEIRPIKE